MKHDSTPTDPHAPKLEYLCDDYLCCDNGCPSVSCRSCGRNWPCITWQATHTAAQLAAKRRWVLRKYHGDDERMINYSLLHPSSYWADLGATREA